MTSMQHRLKTLWSSTTRHYSHSDAHFHSIYIECIFRRIKYMSSSRSPQTEVAAEESYSAFKGGQDSCDLIRLLFWALIACAQSTVEKNPAERFTAVHQLKCHAWSQWEGTPLPFRVYYICFVITVFRMTSFKIFPFDAYHTSLCRPLCLKETNKSIPSLVLKIHCQI